MSLEFQQINKALFKKIVLTKMKWIEAKKIFDDVAEKLFQKYVKRVDDVGFDFEDPDALSRVMPVATTFLGPQNPEWVHTIHRSNATGKMSNRADFEANYDKQPEVIEFVDQIIKQNELSMQPGSNDYKQFCRQLSISIQY